MSLKRQIAQQQFGFVTDSCKIYIWWLHQCHNQWDGFCFCGLKSVCRMMNMEWRNMYLIQQVSLYSIKISICCNCVANHWTNIFSANYKFRSVCECCIELFSTNCHLKKRPPLGIFSKVMLWHILLTKDSMAAIYKMFLNRIISKRLRSL